MTLRDVGLLIFISKTVTLNNMTVVGRKEKKKFLVNTLSFIHQPDKVAQRASDVSAVDWRYQTQKKGIVILDVYSYVFSLGWKSLKNKV